MPHKIEPRQSKRLILSLIISLILACVLAIVPLWASAARMINSETKTVTAATMDQSKVENISTTGDAD